MDVEAARPVMVVIGVILVVAFLAMVLYGISGDQEQQATEITNQPSDQPLAGLHINLFVGEDSFSFTISYTADGQNK